MSSDPMQLFTADTATYDIIDDAHVAGIAAGDGATSHWIFQRSTEGDPDDWGVYFESADPSLADYDLIDKVYLTPQCMEVHFTPDADACMSAWCAGLSVSPGSYQRFVEGMRQVFRGRLESLHLEEGH